MCGKNKIRARYAPVYGVFASFGGFSRFALVYSAVRFRIINQFGDRAVDSGTKPLIVIGNMFVYFTSIFL